VPFQLPEAEKSLLVLPVQFFAACAVGTASANANATAARRFARRDATLGLVYIVCFS